MTRWCLVVEDDRALGEMMADTLRTEGYGVELVRDGEVAVRRLEDGKFDVVLLDIMLPGVNGFEVLRKMRRAGNVTPVLVISARSGDDDRIRGLELEADDYLAKPFHLRELLLRMSAILRRSAQSAAGTDVLEFGGNRVDYRAHRGTTWDGKEIELSASEVRLLRALAARDGAVVSRREIVELLFGPGTPTTARTLDNLILRLRKHFEHDSQKPRFVHTVRGVGWRFEGAAKPPS